MIGQLLAKVIGTQNDREIKRLRPLVAEINALEPTIQTLTDEQLREKTVEFRKRVADGASARRPARRSVRRRARGRHGAC